MSKLTLTVRYAESEGMVVAEIEEVPGACSQGKTREEARANVLDALKELLLARAQPADGQDDREVLVA